MAKVWLNEILTGASFPDLKKAAAATGLKELLKKIKTGDSIFEPVNDEKKKLEKQYCGDFCASIASHRAAVAAGNQNSCKDKKQFAAAATDQQKFANKITKKVKLPSYGKRRVAPKNLPKRRGAGPVADDSGKQPTIPSISRAKVGGLNTQTVTDYKVETVTPRKLDAAANFKNFVAGQAGFKGKAIDKSLSITHDGTPQQRRSRLELPHAG